MQEASYHSVPVIAVPLSLGQEEISQFAVDQGRGLLVRKETLMAGQHKPLLAALLEVVGNSSAYKAQVTGGRWMPCQGLTLSGRLFD